MTPPAATTDSHVGTNTTLARKVTNVAEAATRSDSEYGMRAPKTENTANAIAAFSSRESTFGLTL
jgi:hypothetical protein